MLVSLLTTVYPIEIAAFAPYTDAPGRRGSVLLAGGGITSPEVVRAFIASAGGPDSPIVILAQTQSDPAAGAPLSAALYREHGAIHVDAPVGRPMSEVLALLEKARGVWIPGGDQNRFTQAFPEASGVPAAIRAVWRRGGVVGGTSAGASLMGDLMPSGAETSVTGLRSGACPVADGLHVLPGTIIDQHLFARGRFERLLAGVLEHPHCMGIGVDEDGWLLIRNGNIRMGAGQAAVIRPIAPVRRDVDRLGDSNITLRVLLTGDQAAVAR